MEYLALQLGELTAVLKSDTSDYIKGFKNAEKAAEHYENTTKRAMQNVNKSVVSSMMSAGKSIKDFGEKMTDLGTKLSLAVTAPILAVGGGAIKMAMDAVESENLFEVSMGNMAAQARSFSEKLREELGLNAYEVRKNVGMLNTMMTSMGLNEDAAYNMATGLSQLAYDMASFYNLKPEEAFEKLRAGISGESEPLKQLGIIVNETTSEIWALNNGLIKQGEKMTEQQKVAARYGMIMEATKKAQGDLARTMDSPTNKLRVMTEQAKYAAITLGTALLPTFTAVVNAIQPLLVKLQDLANKFGALTPQMQQNIIVTTALVAAIGPLATIIGGLSTIIGVLTSTVGLAIAGFALWAGTVYLMYKNTKESMEKILPIVKNVADSVKNYMVAKWIESRDQTYAIFNSIVNFFKEWYPLILAALGPMGLLVAWIIGHWEKIKEATIKIWNEVSEALSKWWDELISMVSSWDIWTQVASVWETYRTNVISVLEQLNNDAREWGLNIIKGFVDSIKAGVSWVWDAAVSLAQAANDAIKSTLGIHSPSKVMIELGDQTSEGLIVGLLKNEKKVRDAAKTLADKIQDVFTDLSENMLSITGKSAVYGGSFNAAAAQFQVVETALNKLIELGVNPASEAIQNLATQWKELQTQVVINDLATSFREIETSAKIFGSTFSPIAAKFSAVESAIKSLIKNGIDPASNEIQKLRAEWKKFQTESILEDFNKNLREIEITSAVFGDTFSPIQAQISAVENAMRSLIKNGMNPSERELQKLTADWKRLKKEMVLEDVAKQINKIDLRASLFNENVDNPAKINAIKDAMMELALSGQRASEEFKQLQDQLDSLEEKPHVVNVVLNAMQQLGGSIGKTANSIVQLGTDWGNMLGSFAKGGVGGILGGIAMIPKVISGVKSLWSSFSGKKKVAAFYSDIAQQSEANRQAALENMQPYKDYAAKIRDFSKNSLIEIRGLAEGSVNFLENLNLVGTYTMVSQRIRRFFRKRTYWAQLWSYSFDEAGAESAVAFLDRFMEIASGLSTSVGSAFSSGIKEFLSGKTDWVTTLKEGIKNAIIDAITTAVMQATIIKGALGDLLGELAAGITAGIDVSPIIAKIGNTIPVIAKELEKILTPLQKTIAKVFPENLEKSIGATVNTVKSGVDPYMVPYVATDVNNPYYRAPAMASGGVVSRPTMALIGEAGPEAVIPLDKAGMTGGNQTIIIQLDGRTITQTVVKNMPAVVRMKTGVSL